MFFNLCVCVSFPSVFKSEMWVGWLVVLGLAALRDSISVYIGAVSQREGETGKKG